jgi:hypothetical protein
MGSHGTQEKPLIEMQAEALEILSAKGGKESNADIARSEENILKWMSYLPDDCIRTMVLMGWDIST